METWAIRGLDLHLDVPARHPGEGVRAHLERALREAVREGRLAPGSRLPSSRVLAADLGLARNTVAETYAQLTAEGYLTARQGSGTRVAADAPTRAPEPSSSLAPFPDLPGPLPAYAYDLRPGSPDLSLFPRERWLAAARRALTTASRADLGYADPRGLPALRQALAEYLARVRGVRTHPDLILVCTGYVQAVGLLSRALAAARGARRIAIEEIGLPHTRSLLSRNGLTPVPLPVDSHGARTDALTDREDAVLLTPAHQFPTGAVLSADRRTAVVSWARRTGAVVLEDDYDGEFRYDRHPLGALQGLAPEQVVYIGTASKSLAPGLRLAWLALPPDLLDAVVVEKRYADRHSPVLDQLTLAEFLTSGDYDRHVRRARARYRSRRDRLLSALPPGHRLTGVAAGLHAVLELPASAPSLDEVLSAAHSRDLGLQPLSFFGPRPGPPSLALGYATPPEHAFPTALTLLHEALTDAQRRP